MPATNQHWTDAGRLDGVLVVRQTAPYEDDVSFQPVTERGSVVAQDRTTRIADLPNTERENVELRRENAVGRAIIDLHRAGKHEAAAALALAGEGV